MKGKPKRSELLRSSVSILAYVGSNGSGKTFAAVRDTIHSADRQGRMILSSTPIDHPSYVALQSWTQIFEARDCEILLDEVSGIASARQFATLPAQLETRLQQLRKRNVRVRWTCPNYARADVILREVTKGVVYCQGHLGRTPSGSAWPQHRLFRWYTYDAAAFEAFSLKEMERGELKVLSKQWYWRRDIDPIAARYDTLSEVSTMDHVTIVGTCLDCGGQRKRHACKCGSGHSSLPAPEIPHFAFTVGKTAEAPAVTGASASDTGDTHDVTYAFDNNSN